MKKAIKLIISGIVQGVFFRKFVKDEADRLELKGFVRNTEKGEVEVVAEGEEKNILELIKMCRKGPPSSNVKNINEERRKFSGEFKEFKVLII